jgi:hypothetical protein
LAEFNPRTNYPNILRKIVLINLMLATAMSVLWALKDTLDGVLIGDSFTKRQPSWMFWQKDANMIQQLEATPILVNLDEKQQS